nr:MAG TPA_asm: Super-infection exclusion protein B [Caudoviricetes sp.]
MSVSDFLNILKLPFKYLVAILLILSFLLFAPSSYIANLGINELINEYRTYIGLAFICDLFFILVDVLSLLMKYLRALKKYYSITFIGKRKIKQLTPEEKSILRYYIQEQTRTQTLPFNDGVVAELSNLAIIYRASSLSLGGVEFDYNLNDWAWKYLNKNKDLLK